MSDSRKGRLEANQPARGGRGGHPQSEIPEQSGCKARSFRVAIRDSARIRVPVMSRVAWPFRVSQMMPILVQWQVQGAGLNMDSGIFVPTSLATALDLTSLPAKTVSRGDLTAFLMELTEKIGADSYMLASVASAQGKAEARIIASNWIYDAIQLAGLHLIAKIVQSPLTTPPGAEPQALVTAQAPDRVVSGEEARLLHVLGHGEIYSLAVNVGRQRLFVLFSAEAPQRIDVAALARAQMQCCYLLSQSSGLLADATAQEPLSERERECLYWVSEGKTTEEIAVILGVSPNTVNSYITHAIQKVSAANRAMAIASAIRSGII